MLSKQAFNALLKTLEEPPEYLKFIFATTEIKKIPITVVSRCQRFDLSRIKSDQLFEFIKKITEKEKGIATDEALKLIVKLSEGSVRDALSLLDRGLISNIEGKELDLKKAQKIYGYFEKSSLIELFQNLFEGNEDQVIKIYRKIYESGVDSKIFLNDFLEILYYFKNISSLNIDGTNFTLNDEEFKKIKEIANKIKNETLLLFWQFTIKTLEEIEIVSNQHIAMEMFLIRLIHLKGISNFSGMMLDNESMNETGINGESENNNKSKKKIDEELFDSKSKTIGQIKNIVQEKKLTEKPALKNEQTKSLQIKNFDDLINVCNIYKEIKLKYELETNVNLVSFENQRIEISFNEDLDKEFVKNLSSKLYEWTNNRWIITLSKTKGEPSKKEKEMNKKIELIKNAKNSTTYKRVLDKFLDAELIDVKLVNKEKND